MPQGEGTYGSTVGRPKSLLPKRIVANPATAEEIKTTNRNAKMITTLLVGAAVPLPFRMLGNAGKGFLSGMGFKAIGQTFKKAGTAGNKKGADTVGNRIKQTLAINPKLVNKSPRFANQFGKGQPVMNEKGVRVGTGGTTSYVGLGKDGRTIQNAVEQGPAKFFSKGFYSKTGVSPNKKFDRKHGLMTKDQVNPKPNPLLINNEDLIKKTLEANRLARKILKNGK